MKELSIIGFILGLMYVAKLGMMHAMPQADQGSLQARAVPYLIPDAADTNSYLHLSRQGIVVTIRFVENSIVVEPYAQADAPQVASSLREQHRVCKFD